MNSFNESISVITVTMGRYQDGGGIEGYQLDEKAAKAFCKTYYGIYKFLDYDEKSGWYRFSISILRDHFLSNNIAGALRTFMLLHDFSFLHCNKEDILDPDPEATEE